MEKDRYLEWLENSLGLRFVEMLLISDCQGLGMLDTELIEDFQKLKIDSKLEEDLSKKYRHVLLSKLWIIGAYEMIRVINDINKKTNVLKGKVKGELKEVLTIFTKVRTPLAKLQKPGEERLFSQIATRFLFDPNKGVGWHFYDGKIDIVIFRKDLGDKLLGLLKDIKLYFDEKV